MKKLFLSILASTGLIIAMNAQNISDNAIGLRLGDSDGFGAEVSYQKSLGDINRLELDLGWRDSNSTSGFKLAGIYQWVWVLDGGFNWYAGVGGGVGSYSIDLPSNKDETDTFLFAAGNIGIEYDFDIPLLISLDFRPEIGFGDDLYDNNDLDFDIALGLRYQF
jgi:hypothetical protein